MLNWKLSRRGKCKRTFWTDTHFGFLVFFYVHNSLLFQNLYLLFIKKCNIKFLLRLSKNTFRRKIYKKYPTSFSKLLGVSWLDYLWKITKNSSSEYTFLYEEKLPYKTRFSNRKLLHKKHQKQKWITVQKVLLHLSLLEFS